MTYSLSNNCTKNYYNRTLTVQVIVEDVVTWIFLKHSVYWAFLPINQLGIAGSLQQRKVSQSGRSRLANGEPTNAQWTMLTSHNRHLLLASVLTATWHNVWHARKTILFIYLSIYFLYNNPHKTVEWRSKQCTWTSVSQCTVRSSSLTTGHQ